MKIKRLVEDSTKGGKDELTSQMLLDMNADAIEVETQQDIIKALDNSYRAAMRAIRTHKAVLDEYEEALKKDEPLPKKPQENPTFGGNVLLTGLHGVGKSSIVDQWCKEKNLFCVHKEANNMNYDDFCLTVYDPEDKRMKKAATSEYDVFANTDDGYGVLFIDEINRPSDMRALNAILNLASAHMIYSDKTKEQRVFLPALLFVVAAMNPGRDFEGGSLNLTSDEEDAMRRYYSGTQALDPALKSRFEARFVQENPKATLKHLLDLPQFKITKEILADQEELKETLTLRYIATALLDSRYSGIADRHFPFTTVKTLAKLVAQKENGDNSVHWNGLTTNPRGLTNLLLSHGYSVDEFLDYWDSYCNNQDYEQVKNILTNKIQLEDEMNRIVNNLYKDGKYVGRTGVEEKENTKSEETKDKDAGFDISDEETKPEKSLSSTILSTLDSLS